MCFSFRTAVASYILALSSAVFAFATRQVVMGCLILSYAQMQLSELLIWRGIDTNNTNMNRTGTSIGKYLLATHPFAIGLGIILSVLFVSKRNLTPTDFIPIILGTLFFIFIVVYYYLPGGYPNETYPLKKCKRDKNCKIENNLLLSRDKSGKIEDNRLMWPYPHRWYNYGYILTIFILFIWIKPIASKMVFFLIFTLTFILTYIIYPTTIGSVWCWSTSFIAPIIAVVGWVIIRKLPNSQILA